MVSSVRGELAMDSGTTKKANVSMEGVSKHFSGAMIHDMRQLSQRPNVLPANYDHFSFFSSASKRLGPCSESCRLMLEREKKVES